MPSADLMREFPRSFVLDGFVTRNDSEEGDFTPAEANEIIDGLLEFFAARDCSFGGLIGPSTFEPVVAEPTEEAGVVCECGHVADNHGPLPTIGGEPSLHRGGMPFCFVCDDICEFAPMGVVAQEAE